MASIFVWLPEDKNNIKIGLRGSGVCVRVHVIPSRLNPS